MHFQQQIISMNVLDIYDNLVNCSRMNLSFHGVNRNGGFHVKVNIIDVNQIKRFSSNLKIVRRTSGLQWTISSQTNIKY